jgi:hypothetical protein
MNTPNAGATLLASAPPEKLRMPLDPQSVQSLAVLPLLHEQGLHCPHLDLTLPWSQPLQPGAGQSLAVLPLLHGQGLHCPHMDLTLPWSQPLQPGAGQFLTALPLLHEQGLHCPQLRLTLPWPQPLQPGAGQFLTALPCLHGQGLHCPQSFEYMLCGQHALTPVLPAVHFFWSCSSSSVAAPPRFLAIPPK